DLLFAENFNEDANTIFANSNAVNIDGFPAHFNTPGKNFAVVHSSFSFYPNSTAGFDDDGVADFNIGKDGLEQADRTTVENMVLIGDDLSSATFVVLADTYMQWSTTNGSLVQDLSCYAVNHSDPVPTAAIVFLNTTSSFYSVTGNPNLISGNYP